MSAGGGNAPGQTTPVASRAVVVTRAESVDGALSSELRNLGLRVLLWPAVSVSPPETGELDKALEDVGAFDWIVFASRHAVAAVTERIAAAPRGVRIAAVGQATAQVLRQRGWSVDLLPSEPNAAGLVAAFAAADADAAAAAPASAATAANATGAANAAGTANPATTRAASAASAANAETAPDAGARPRTRGNNRQTFCKGARILFPASSRALPTIAAGLSQLGAEVVQVEAYRTESDSALDAEACRASIARDEIGAVTFASPSAVEELERALGKEHFNKLLSTAGAVAIGPTTARALSERGHAPVLAESATLHGLALTTFRLLQTRH